VSTRQVLPVCGAPVVAVDAAPSNSPSSRSFHIAGSSKPIDVRGDVAGDKRTDRTLNPQSYSTRIVYCRNQCHAPGGNHRGCAVGQSCLRIEWFDRSGNGGLKAMLAIVARVMIGVVLATVFLVVILLAYTSDLLSTQSRQRRDAVPDTPGPVERFSFLDKVRT
jgi:hypothetical protein